MDIIMKLCFGRDMNCTQGTEGTAALIDSMTTLTRNFALIKHFPFLGTILQSFPNPILAFILPGFVEFRNVSRWCYLAPRYKSQFTVGRLTDTFPIYSNVPNGLPKSASYAETGYSQANLAARRSLTLY